MKDVLIIPGAIEAVATRKDKSVRITIGTNELEVWAAAELYRLQNAFVYVAIKEEAFGRDEVEGLERMESEMVGDARKTSAQRLRAVLFRVWETDSKGFKDFNSFYLAEMERIITHFKGKI